MTARQAIALVAWREIRERLRSRIFLVLDRADARAGRRLDRPQRRRSTQNADLPRSR